VQFSGGADTLPFPGRRLFNYVSKAASGLLHDIAPNFGEMCGQSYLERAWDHAVTTNNTITGALAPPGMTLLTSGKMAEMLGTITFFRWFFTYPKRPPITPVAGAAAANTLLVSGVWFLGTGIGLDSPRLTDPPRM
jgi:hypothetical protein